MRLPARARRRRTTPSARLSRTPAWWRCRISGWMCWRRCIIPKSIRPPRWNLWILQVWSRARAAGEGLGNKFLSHIREVDAIVHVVRCFEDENIIHVGRQRRSRARHRDHQPRADSRRHRDRRQRASTRPQQAGQEGRQEIRRSRRSCWSGSTGASERRASPRARVELHEEEQRTL